ncbi:prephenate dehydrogenase [Bacillus gaemokensis]|uniref:Prephenate dehydrogenase n=1 Tax=Bacillus gaemokensis TaxID=574375 RepID=A0A073KKQ1_9BACI|nr:prephenate dehydrogenase [Bacillus gaemokensis]KEK22898.1 prephenate dehydrogenase [Bacillus gaemokensis]KYG34698.1 prephenate dehydrogenase [Bacillus gaemokensis]
MCKKVVLIGTGLIGGSLALAIKKEYKTAIIIGYDIHSEQVERAKELHVVDEIAEDLQTACEEANLIIFASPVEETTKLLRKLATYDLREEVIVTDVGSTKGKIMNEAEALLPKGISFIGGHPMAGSHKTGVESAKAHLFENAFYILTPMSHVPNHRVEELKEWLKGTGSHFLVLNTEEHDYVTGIVSHFPHLIAAGLVKQVEKHAGDNPLIHQLAAGGFKDITRIASSSPKMWSDIVKQNRDHLLQLLEEWILEMEELHKTVAEGNADELQNYFANAKEYRDSLPVRKSGAIPAYHDLYVDVLDKVGALAHITNILAHEAISITNLQILEAREGLLGVLRISFQREEDRLKAAIALQKEEYQTYETM